MVRSKILPVQNTFGAVVQPDPVGVRLPHWNQVHGIRIVEFSQSTGDSTQTDLGDVDGIYVRTPGLTAAVRTADCVPILLARGDGLAAAALHAGWRGSIGASVSTSAQVAGTTTSGGKGIVEAFGEFLHSVGDNASHWVAAIGPSARGCCYEVSQEIADSFAQIVPTAVRKRNLDLAVFNAAHLRKIGVQKIDVLPYCTICETGQNGFVFHSFRREKNRARQVSWLTLS